MSIDIDAIQEEFHPDLFDNIGEQTVTSLFLFHHFNCFYRLKERFTPTNGEILSHLQINVDLSNVDNIPTTSE